MNHRCYVNVASPLPDATPPARLSINPRVTSMQVRAELNAGYTDGAVGLDLFSERPYPAGITRAPLMEQPGDVPPFAHVTFEYDGVQVFTGRATTFDRGGFNALGYGVTCTVDDVVTDVAPGDPVADGALGRRAIQEAAPFLSAATGLAWIEPTTRHNPDEIRFATPRDALDLIAKASGQAWVVFDDMTVQLLDSDANPPDVPDYHVPYDGTVSWSEDWQDVYTHALLVITGTNGQETVIEIPNPDLPVSALGFTRRYPLHSQAEHAESAILVAQQWLREHARPRITASVTRTAGRGLERVVGGEAPQYTVKPGQWIQVADKPKQRITRTDWDGWREQVTATLGQPARGSLVGVIERAARAAAALGGGRDALSLGRIGR